jgi:hypothetical protein
MTLNHNPESELIAEDELRAALRSHKIDPAAFEAGILSRIHRVEAERANDPLANAPHLRKVAAAPLPTPVIRCDESNPCLESFMGRITRRITVAAGLVAMLLCLVVLIGRWGFGWDESYTARAVIQFKAQSPFLLSPLGPADYANYKRTQIAWVKSPFVINKALNEPKVKTSSYVVNKEDPVLALQRDLQVDFDTGPEFLRIGLTGQDQEEVINVVNAVRQVYVAEVLDAEQSEKRKRLKMLTDAKNKYEKISKEYRKTLNTLLQGVGSAETKTQELIFEIKLKQLDAVQNEVLRVQSLKLAEQMLLETTKDGNPIPKAVLEDELKKEPKFARYYKVISDLEHDIKVTKERPSNPGAELSALEERLETAKKEVKDLLEKLEPELTESLEKLRRKDLDAHKKRLEDLEKMEKWWTAERDRRAKELDTFKKEKFGAEELRIEVLQQEEIVKKFTAGINALQVELDAPARWSLLEPAIATRNVDRNWPWVLGFIVCGLILFFLRGFRFKRQFRSAPGCEQHSPATP